MVEGPSAFHLLRGPVTATRSTRRSQRQCRGVARGRAGRSSGRNAGLQRRPSAADVPSQRCALGLPFLGRCGRPRNASNGLSPARAGPMTGAAGALRGGRRPSVSMGHGARRAIGGARVGRHVRVLAVGRSLRSADRHVGGGMPGGGLGGVTGMGSGLAGAHLTWMAGGIRCGRLPGTWAASAGRWVRRRTAPRMGGGVRCCTPHGRRYTVAGAAAWAECTWAAAGMGGGGVVAATWATAAVAAGRGARRRRRPSLI